jgi:hypothetical protein
VCRATSPLRDQFGRKLPMRPCLTPAVERAQKAAAILKGAQRVPRLTLGVMGNANLRRK